MINHCPSKSNNQSQLTDPDNYYDNNISLTPADSNLDITMFLNIHSFFICYSINATQARGTFLIIGFNMTI